MKRLFSEQGLLNYQQRLNRLRCFTVVFFMLLVIPVSVIFYIGFNQFEIDQLTQVQRQTEKVTQSINKRLFKRWALTNVINPRDFDYYQQLYNPISQQLTQTLSPLATPEYYERYPGIIGYFQVDQHKLFNSPMWPFVIDSQNDKNATENKMEAELVKRRKIALKLYKITSRSNELQSLIDQGLPDKNTRFQSISDVPEYIIYYRFVTFNDQTKLQGYVINREPYLNSIIVDALDMVQFETPIAVTLQSPKPSTKSNYFFKGINEKSPVEISQPKQLGQQFNQLFINSQEIYWPFYGYIVTYSTASFQLTSAAIYSGIIMAILFLAMVLSCYGFYRLGVKQLKLAEQRLNFVSSVSHELKTPLTSIRMYSEMLKTGMVLSDNHRNEYYEFIHDESERLSRLIDNILQLSKLSQPQHSVNSQYTKLSVLTDIIRSKVSSLLVKSGFQLNISHAFEDPEKVELFVDVDAFSQVVINITDNAIKFFDSENIPESSRKKIDYIFSFNPKNQEQVQLEIRDYGSGISAEQEDKIFDLFYRGGSELTRTTQGTGIGLALVNELVLAQQGTIRVQRMTPGLAMKMSFKCKLSS